MTATRQSWTTIQCPEEREHFDLPLTFNIAESERIKLGHIPQDMSDKWFIFLEEEWLYFHRSWTGHCIFGLKLASSTEGYTVVDAWASRDSTCYKSSGIEEEKQLLKDLIRHLLLK